MFEESQQWKCVHAIPVKETIVKVQGKSSELPPSSAPTLPWQVIANYSYYYSCIYFFSTLQNSWLTKSPFSIKRMLPVNFRKCSCSFFLSKRKENRTGSPLTSPLQFQFFKFSPLCSQEIMSSRNPQNCHFKTPHTTIRHI